MEKPAIVTKTTNQKLHGVELDVVVSSFTDRIVIMIYTNNKLGRLFHSSLGISDLSRSKHEVGEIGNFPITPLIGASSQEASLHANIYVSLIASMIKNQAPEDTRSIVVGLGPQLARSDEISDKERELFSAVIKLVEESRVW